MTEQIQEVIVEKREIIGKASGKRAPEGCIPATVYGGGTEPISIYVDSKKVIEILRSEKGKNSILLFSLKGTKRRRHVMIKDFQIHPTENNLIHADFRRTDLEEKVKVKVPVICEGIPEGVKVDGGLMDQIMREVEIECQAQSIPAKITLDISSLKIHQSIKIQDLKLGDEIKVLAEDKSQPIVHVIAPKAEVEAVAAVAEEGAPAEPEVLTAKKKVEEEAEGADSKKDAKKEPKKETKKEPKKEPKK
jgi:large subunit ribosomal protein L25